MGALTEKAVELIVDYFGVSSYPARKAYLSTIGAPFQWQLERMFPDEPKARELACAEFDSWRHEMYTHALAFPGALEFLQRLNRRHHVAVVSSTPTDILLRWFITRGFLPQIVGHSEGDDKAVQISRAVGDHPLRPYFIGDAPRDAEYARTAGVEFIGVAHTIPLHEWPSEARVVSTITDVEGVLFA